MTNLRYEVISNDSRKSEDLCSLLIHRKEHVLTCTNYISYMSLRRQGLCQMLQSPDPIAVACMEEKSPSAAKKKES
jgi:hypothetical protein